MAKVTPDMVVEFVRLHRAGHSFREIGRQKNLDYRTIQSWVQRAEDVAAREHWAEVARMTDGEHLREHRDLLTHAARGISEAVQADSKLLTSSWSPKDLLYSRVVLDRGRAAEILRRGGAVDTVLVANPNRDDNPPEVPRLVPRLVDALMEHEPNLGREVQEWMDGWEAFSKSGTSLWRRPAGYARTRSLPTASTLSAKWWWPR